MIKENSENSTIKVTMKNGMFEIHHVNHTYPSHITICTNPVVITDYETLKLLKNESIDFSYSTNEFLITRRLNELSAYA